MLPCNFTSENYILIIAFKYNNYDRGMLSDLSVQMETPNYSQKYMSFYYIINNLTTSESLSEKKRGY